MVPRTAVFANDVPVGQVSEVERSGWHAQVKFLVRKDIKLPQNIEIDVRQTSLLGEKYLALVEPAPGTASDKRLSDGDFIPLVPHQPQPGGRGGAGRPVGAAGRRRRRLSSRRSATS